MTDQEKIQKLTDLLEGFANTAESAVRHGRQSAQRVRGGQQVPFHGDFANASPGVLSRLDWWARTIREVLEEVGYRHDNA